MNYSCFDQLSGKYRYFKDDREVPVNGDLPVPTWLKSRVANKIGVPTAEAGRPLPSDAKFVGIGASAKGQIVQCAQRSSGFGALPQEQQRKAVAIAAAGMSAYFAYSKQTVPAIALAAIALGAYVTQ